MIFRFTDMMINKIAIDEFGDTEILITIDADDMTSKQAGKLAQAMVDEEISEIVISTEDNEDECPCFDRDDCPKCDKEDDEECCCNCEE